MDWSTLLFYVISCNLFYFWGRKDAPANARLTNIKELMKRQDRDIIKGQDQAPTRQQYATMWVDIWLEVAPHEDR
jgi:hypothetical protein